LPSKRWDDRKWWLNQTDRSYFPNPGWQVINEGQASGTILGANLCTFNLLRGTEFWPKLDGAILFLEDDEMPKEYTAVEFDRNLQSLIHQPEFSGVKGIVIGRFQKVSEMTEEKIRAIIRSKKELNHIPVIAGVDFGHTDPKITFPIGGTAEIKAQASNANIKIIEH